MKIPLPLLLALAAVPPSLGSGESPEPRNGIGQLGAPLKWIPAPGAQGQFHLAQETADGRLYLTPNEAFFPLPRRGLRAEGSGGVPDVANLNGGQSFDRIAGWEEGDKAEWGLFFPRAGEIEVELQAEGGGKFTLTLGEETREVRSGTARFEIPGPGRLSLVLIRTDSGGPAAIRWLAVTGSAAEGASVVRKRWRPAAAHTKFRSSAARGNVRLWIMEMDAVPGDLGFYCPITTPFGYYGPTWNADGTVNSSFNFSLWSFGRNEPEPPVEQLSHLLAIGNPEARFGGFDHEGTGVKVRDWEPLEGRQGQMQAIALRVEPGETYDTYYSYFFENDSKRWRLFGSGRKWNKGKPLESLWVGSFVEVPGPPPVQRSGPYLRTMRYRGWVVNEEGDLFPLDRMANGNVDKETGYTHTDRGVTEDGWFFLTTGGWSFRKPPAGGEEIELSGRPGSGVEFLDAEDLAYLSTVPSSIEIELIERRGAFARVTFAVRNAGENPEVVLHHGSAEGLTLADRWPNRTEVAEIREGQNQFVIEGIPEGEPLHLRAFLRNDEGQFWSSETFVADAP